jgi:hypothetical protein
MSDSIPLVAVEEPPIKVPPARKLERHGIYTRVLNGMRVHAITCGWVRYRNAHVHSTLNPYLVLLDPRWCDWMPVYSWIIEHPEGTIVIDTGETSRASQKTLKGLE